MVWLLLLLACGDLLLACGGDTPPPPATCDAAADPMARDICYFEEMKALPAERWRDVLTLREKIVDPIPKNAGTLTFVRDKHKDLPREAEDPLCSPLPETEQRQCRRIFESAHLQR